MIVLGIVRQLLLWAGIERVQFKLEIFEYLQQRTQNFLKTQHIKDSTHFKMILHILCGPNLIVFRNEGYSKAFVR
jgi:hypothetical protein